VDLGVFTGEFAQTLAVGAARRGQGIARPHDKHFGNAPLPATTIAAIAAASAQVPTGKAAFSTFVPEKMAPESVQRAAPTENPEYGA
jgi:hypothetical protein